MDCERFEAALIDELYDELDEVTTAATRRHAAGCVRCASLLGGLRATRRVAALPLVEPSADLEDRILAAARYAQKVVPVRRKISRSISWAGSWAMRPQTAMAAVFILMVGSSVLFVRRRKVADDATVTVTAQGAPAASAPLAAIADESPPLDSKVAAAAHGAGPAGSAATSDSLGKDPADSKGAAGIGSAGRRSTGTDDQGVSGERVKSEPAIAPAAAPAALALGGSAGEEVDPPNSQSPAAGPRQQTPFDHAKALYVAGDYPAAVDAYDAIAAGGDLDAALWAARSVREGNGGCAVAKDRFDQIAARAWGTPTGYQATLEAGRCSRVSASMNS